MQTWPGSYIQVTEVDACIYYEISASLWRIVKRWLNPLPDDKLKEFADDNFKFDENGRKLSKQVENTVGKGEFLVMSNFSFSHSVFKRLVSQGRQKVSLCGNGLMMERLPLE